MYRLILFFVSWFCLTTFISFEVMAQSDVSEKKLPNKKSDSLWNIYNTAQQSGLEDTTQINRLLDISEYYLKLQDDSSRILSELAIQNNQLKETFSRLSILSDIGQKITAKMDENALISILKESIEHIMPVDEFGISVYNPRLQAIEYHNFIEENETLPFHIESATEGTNSLSVQCFLEDKEIFIIDVRKEYFQKNQKYVSTLFGKLPQTAFLFLFVFVKNRLE